MAHLSEILLSIFHILYNNNRSLNQNTLAVFGDCVELKEKFIRYLNLLEEKNPRLVSEELCELIEEDPELERGDEKDADLRLTEKIHISYTEKSLPGTRKFFDWWSRAFQRSREEILDQLTGVYTRSYWERKLKIKYTNYGDYLVGMVDIDHFKRFNDLYGHQTGDRVLAAVGDKLVDFLPDSAEIIRYGGEEFLLVFPGFDVDETRKILDNFRRFLAANTLYENQPEQITVSTGLNDFRGTPGEPEQMIRRADLALYEAKRNGRNRIEIYAPHLNRKDNYYVWGIYRYFRGKDRRIFLGRQNFLVNRQDKLFFYDWSSNSARELSPPEQLDLPVNYAVPYKSGFLAVDASGILWKIMPQNIFDKISGPHTPTFVKLVGEHERIFGVGINNQLYRVEAEIDRYCSLPEEWNFIVAPGRDEIYLLNQNRLFSLEDPTEIYRLPERSDQVSSSARSVYLTGCSGRSYRFDTAQKRWSKLEIINMEPDSIHIKKIQSTGKRLLIRDQTGRLLFCRRKRKSVAQEMSLFSPARL